MCYRIPRPGALWHHVDPNPLPDHGGRARPPRSSD
jgi:hypothetical protein